MHDLINIFRRKTHFARKRSIPPGADPCVKRFGKVPPVIAAIRAVLQ
jgi:hypothetical protein